MQPNAAADTFPWGCTAAYLPGFSFTDTVDLESDWKDVDISIAASTHAKGEGEHFPSAGSGLEHYSKDDFNNATAPSQDPTSSLWIPSSIGHQCDWPNCPFKSPAIEGLKAHTKDHIQDVLQALKYGGKCTWPDCHSNAVFKSQKLLETHINNIHVNPLVCTVPGCKHQKPFRANHDLQRHVNTVHSQQSNYKCPYEDCHFGKGQFSRKDKWLRHIKQHHDTERCPYDHCQDDTSPRESTAKHLSKRHGSLECAIRSCEGTTSRFTENQLLEHLQCHHSTLDRSMEWPAILDARDLAKEAKDHTLRRMDTVYDCSVCLKTCRWLKP